MVSLYAEDLTCWHARSPDGNESHWRVESSLSSLESTDLREVRSLVGGVKSLVDDVQVTSQGVPDGERSGQVTGRGPRGLVSAAPLGSDHTRGLSVGLGPTAARGPQSMSTGSTMVTPNCRVLPPPPGGQHSTAGGGGARHQQNAAARTGRETHYFSAVPGVWRSLTITELRKNGAKINCKIACI